MILTAKVSRRTAERLNAIIGHAMDSIKDRGDLREYFDCKEKDLEAIERFRKSIVNELVKP